MDRNALAVLRLVLLAGAPLAAVVATPATASADAPCTSCGGGSSPPTAPPIDVVVKEEPPPRRVVALEWNPVDLLFRRISVNLEIVPATHHGIILTPYYFDSSTASFTASSGVEVSSQRFQGFGGELGYRYYTGLGGPRGLFVGPSLIVADVQATPAAGSTTSLTDFGVAVDIGYQMLVAERWTVALGVGAEYVFTSKSLPDQQWPANLYANAGFHPRPLVALGYAF